MRLPAPTVIRGSIAIRDPGAVDMQLIGPGYRLEDQIFDLPSLGDAPPDDAHTMLTVRDMVRASETRVYVLLAGPWDGWWRIDACQTPAPDRSEIVGELTPVPDCRSYLVIPASQLRVDDLIYASGLPEGIATRVLDVVHDHDGGRCSPVLLRTVFGWYSWHRTFAHVANL